MRHTRHIVTALITLATLAGVPAMAAEVTWYANESDAVTDLTGDAATPVFECTGCDADDPRHRVTREFILSLLGEFRENGFGERGTFLLRERSRPRFHVDSNLVIETGGLPAPGDCPGSDWVPSVNLWAYDLGAFEAEPLYSGCYPVEVQERISRVRCPGGCELGTTPGKGALLEQLQEVHQQAMSQGADVASGRIFFIDAGRRGFRQLDYRAFADALYIGPADGDYFRFPMTSTDGSQPVTGVRAAAR